MKLTKQRLIEIIKEEILNEAVGSYKSIFDYDAEDPDVARYSYMEMFDGAEPGYSESGDTYGWNNNKNWQKAVDEYHKEIFKFVDEYAKTAKKAGKMMDKTDKIFKKWRKTDGSKMGDGHD